ncbi:S41 family peptidase [bacterium]|nr:S41 family peptidase [bacterium]
MSRNKLISLFLIMLVIFTLFSGTKAFGILQDIDIFTKMRVFTEIVNNIKDYYVDEKNPVSLVDSAIQGMLKELDPHSVLLPPEKSKDMDERFQGFGGIGIWFRIINEKITITDVFKNGPCDKLGLERGDQIVKIEGESAIGIKLDEVAPKLKGLPGTNVKVHVNRPGWDEPKEFTIVREKIPPESISHVFMLDDEIGYIEMDKFSRTTVIELERALKSLEDQNMKKLILDLRRNPGGYLPISVGVADKFLPGGKKIVYTKGKNRDSFKEFYSSDRDTHKLLPMIILISESSASASEIVSGALQDWDRAMIIGTTSFGKALVQTPLLLTDDSRLLLTTARYYTPSGRCIQKNYEGKSKEEYYKSARDKDYNNENSGIDSLTYETNSGRKVYGGGGISPDIVIDYTSSVDTTDWKFISKLSLFKSPLDMGFMFADNYVEQHQELKKDIKHFIEHFEINEEILNEYKSFLKDKEKEIDEDEFSEHKEAVNFLLKAEFAHQLWGKNEFWQVYINRDEQLKQAVTYFDKAEELLIENYNDYLVKE